MLDIARDPPHFDMDATAIVEHGIRYTSGEKAGQTTTFETVSRERLAGIYTLSDGQLTICWKSVGKGISPEAVRPADFTAPKGSGRSLLTLRRVRDAHQLRPEELTGVEAAVQRIETKQDLMAICTQYLEFLSDRKRPPAGVEELAAFALAERARAALRSDSYTVIWGARVASSPDERARTILAYERKVPTDGGIVGYQDATTASLTAQEFRRARKSGPTHATVAPTEHGSAVEAGVKDSKTGKWTQAQEHLEEALRTAPDDQSRLKVYEHLVPVYERLPTIDKLVEAHQFMLDQAADTPERMTAADRFLESVVRRARSRDRESRGTRTVLSPVARPTVEVPQSETAVIADRFEERLVRNPNDEGALWVLNEVYSHLTPAPDKRRDVLARVHQLLRARGKSLEDRWLWELAGLYVSTGRPREGAELYGQVERVYAHSPEATIALLSNASDAWRKAGDKQRALEAVIRASELLAKIPPADDAVKTVDSNAPTDDRERLGAAFRAEFLADQAKLANGFDALRHERLGDLYLAIDEPGRAIPEYRVALGKVEEVRLEGLQVKLRDALERAGVAVGGDPELAKLLDPKRALRMEAEGKERDAAFSLDKHSRFVEMLEVAKSWARAGDKDKLLSAGKRAEMEIPRHESEQLQNGMPSFLIESSIQNLHARLAEFYADNSEPLLAAKQYVAALKRSRSGTEVELTRKGLAEAVKAGGIEAKDLGPEVPSLLDPSYEYRAAAKGFESQAGGADLSLLASGLAHAARSWAMAGDTAEAIRVARKAGDAIERVPSTRSPGSVHEELGKLFMELGEPKLAIEEFRRALQKAAEFGAPGYYDQFAAAAGEAGIAVPTMEAARAPNTPDQCRARAQEYEQMPAADGQSRADNLVRAANQWLRAGEKNRAVAAARKAHEAMDGAPAHRLDYLTHAFLAEVCATLGETESAVRHYERAIQGTTDGDQKEQYRKALELVRSRSPVR